MDYFNLIIMYHEVNDPPTLNPDGGGDRTVDVIEGSSIILTCYSNSAIGDLYQWIHPNGLMTPGAPANSPIEVTLNNITRNESGVYICQGSRNGTIDSTLKNNVTLNVQCELLHIFYCVAFTHYNIELMLYASVPNLLQTDPNTHSLLEINVVNINVSSFLVLMSLLTYDFIPYFSLQCYLYIYMHILHCSFNCSMFTCMYIFTHVLIFISIHVHVNIASI